MIRVLQVYRTYFPDTQGGLEEVIRQICRQDSDDIQIRVVTLSPAVKKVELIHYEGVEVYRLPLAFEIASCSIALKGIGLFRRLVAETDIVHYHYPWPFGDVLYSLFSSHKPSVLTYHSDIIRQKWLKRFYKPLKHYFLSGMDAVVATSPNYLESSDTLKQHASKVRVIPIGLGEEQVEFNDECLQHYSLEPEKFFLFVGVLRYYKGLDILLRAAVNAEYKIVIVGAGPEENNLKRLAKELGLKNVVFTGYQPDNIKNALLKHCRGVVLPSYYRSEAFGVFLLEGAKNCKPLVSAEIGTGMSYINIHQETGFCVEPNDAKSLRSAMDQLYNNSDKAKVMGFNARKRFEELFSAGQMTNAYGQLYREIYSSRFPGREVELLDLS